MGTDVEKKVLETLEIKEAIRNVINEYTGKDYSELCEIMKNELDLLIPEESQAKKNWQAFSFGSVFALCDQKGICVPDDYISITSKIFGTDFSR